ncbi:hypothetical protein K1719_028634 [Acacia pycnantha]|nr:hypothetical protein K1719_028634 [Acacia pycnantha]
MSYRETLLQNVNSKKCWWEWSKNEEEEDVEEYGAGTDFAKVLNPHDGICIDLSNPLCPKFDFEEKEKERLMRPFRRTLVVKLMGRQLSYGFMVKKLSQIWARKGLIDVFDLENDYYLVNFQHKEDYMEALTGGPWVITDAYLNVARWRPNFNPKAAKIESVVAWVRFPDLPAPLFDKKFLMNLGNSIGKVIRLDVHTAHRARGKFARMCVELDLTKPLIPEFSVEGQTLSIVYESLGCLCTRCGRIGHNKEACEALNRKTTEGEMEVEEMGGKKSPEGAKEDEGERWKIVQRPRRPNRSVITLKEQQKGSRFTVLREESEDELGELHISKPGNKGDRRRGSEISSSTEKGLRAQGSKAEREEVQIPILSCSNKANNFTEDKRNLNSQEWVPEKILVQQKWQEVRLSDKENLQPGHHTNGLRSIDAMEMGQGQCAKDKGDPIESTGMSMEEGGAASKGVAAVIREMKFKYKVDIFVILEPRTSGATASKIIKNWGFKHSIRREAIGFSGGIWIIWDREELIVDVEVSNEQFIHCKLCLEGKDMLFTAVYANPNEHQRIRLWDLLNEIANNVEEPWMLAGDFNEIKSPMEQKGGGRTSEVRCRRFQNWIQECNLIDLDVGGPFFTWKGPKWEGLDRVYKRLDRCLCNVEWHEQFVNAVIKVLPRLCSDHHPLLVQLNGQNQVYRARNFRYEAMWQMHGNFVEVVNESWKGEYEAHVKLNRLQENLICWNREVFGRIATRKKQLFNRLYGIQKSIESQYGSYCFCDGGVGAFL